MRICFAVLLAILVSGCASTPPAPVTPHYATLQDYLIANHRDLTTYYRHTDPDKLMQCYADSAVRTIPPELQPAVLAVANKSAAGETLSPSEADLKAQWLDARPRPIGENEIDVSSPRALDILRDIATTCWVARVN